MDPEDNEPDDDETEPQFVEVNISSEQMHKLRKEHLSEALAEALCNTLNERSTPPMEFYITAVIMIGTNLGQSARNQDQAANLASILGAMIMDAAFRAFYHAHASEMEGQTNQDDEPVKH